MASDRSSILGKIKGLIARAESDFAEEARTSAHLAFQLMKKHDITFAELAGDTTPATGFSPDEIEHIVAEMMAQEMAERGRKGGLARAKNLSQKRRSEIARKGGLARQGWKRTGIKT